MKNVIYRFTNLVNGKVYIGQTKNFRRRFDVHKRDAKDKEYPLYRAIRKYGWDNFKIEHIFHPLNLDLMEIY